MDEIQKALAPLKAMRDDLDAEEQKLREKLSFVTDERKRLDRVMRAAGMLEPRATKPRARKAPERALPAEKVEAVRAVLRSRTSDDVFSPSGLALEIPGMTNTTVDRAIQLLREGGEVRLVGKIKGGGRGYAVTPHFLNAHNGNS